MTRPQEREGSRFVLGRVFSTAVLVLAVQGLLGSRGMSAATFGLDSGYPGPDPGPARIEYRDGVISAGTGAFTASWTLAGSRLEPRGIRDELSAKSLALGSEVFVIVLADGRRYPTSAFTVEGEPRLGPWTPEPKASRMAARIAGRMVEVRLCSVDGRLRVAWRAVVHDGANYVREEVEVSAPEEDCVVQGLSWLDFPLPGATTAGRVDGSPMTVGDFFLGCEDPHALNVVEALRTVGVWSSGDVALGEPREKTWVLDPLLLRAGTNEIEFRYERGPHRLDIHRVALLADGEEVARDDHPGRAGVEHVNNVYVLTLPELKPGARYELRASLGTDPLLKLEEGRSVDSFGIVLVRDPKGPVTCRVRRDTPLRRGETLDQSFVLGVAPPGQMRRAFLYYLERERAHPYRPFLHYNSWYDTAWAPFALNESNCLEAIDAVGGALVRDRGVVVDAMVFDDGWDDPKSLWHFHGGFPRGFTPLAEKCREYGTRLGVWLSPFGGYGEPKEQRLAFGRAQGYETNATGFSLAGPKYYGAFRDACVGMIRDFGVNHFKFDGIASGMSASGPGSGYLLDTAAMRRLMLELRRVDPDLYINLTTGSWPSPFWLRYADSVWRQGGDMGLAGKGPKQQQWLTYRDQETYRNIVCRGPLFPLSSLMTQGVAYSRHGSAGERTFDSAGFKDDVRAFFGSGTGLQELYIQPGRLTAEDWNVLAEAAKWSRANADVLVDTHWVGGDPGKLEPYGFAAWSRRKGVLMVRNPDDRARELVVDIGTAFELPARAPARYTLRSPWAEDRSRPALHAESGRPLRIGLDPFAVLVLDAAAAE